MEDVANILGLSGSVKENPSEASKILGLAENKNKMISKGPKKPKGMSREVFGLLGQDSILSSLQPQPSNQHAQLFKSKRTVGNQHKWVWSEVFTRDTNNNNNQSLVAKCRNRPKIYHWLKSELKNVEYPYLKFDIQLDRINYNDDEYELLLQSDSWTKSETDYLIDLCYAYDLRWPVIVDRYALFPLRRPEEIKERFYQVVTRVLAHRGGSETSLGDLNSSYNAELERTRRIQQELLFHKTKQEVSEESAIKEELKVVETALKKTKKSSKAQDKATGASSAAAAAGETVIPEPPVSLEGRPALQSGRLLALTGTALGASSVSTSAESNTALSKTLLKKLQCLLRDLGLPEKLLPTKAVCDMYDQVRRDGLALLSIQNLITRREKELAAIKANLSSSTCIAATGLGSPAAILSADIRVSQSALTAKPPPALPACTVRAQLHLAQTQPGAPSQHQPQLLPSNAAHAINSAGVSGTGPESTIGGTLPQMQSQAPSSSMSTQSLAQATMNTNQKQVAAKKHSQKRKKSVDPSTAGMTVSVEGAAAASVGHMGPTIEDGAAAVALGTTITAIATSKSKKAKKNPAPSSVPLVSSPGFAPIAVKQENKEGHGSKQATEP